MTRVTRSLAGLAGVCLTVGLLSGPATAAGGYGHTAARDGVLRNGCHDYAYRYRITPPTDDWTLETFLRDPDREGLASGAFTSDSDVRQQTSRFRFCRYSTRPGRFTIRALLHWYGATGAEHQVWLDPSHFRLRRPR